MESESPSQNRIWPTVCILKCLWQFILNSLAVPHFEILLIHWLNQTIRLTPHIRRQKRNFVNLACCWKALGPDFRCCCSLARCSWCSNESFLKPTSIFTYPIVLYFLPHYDTAHVNKTRTIPEHHNANADMQVLGPMLISPNGYASPLWASSSFCNSINTLKALNAFSRVAV